MKFIVCASLVLLTECLFGQITLSGKITSQNNHVIAGASIVVVKHNQTTILAYSISDHNGMYRIVCNENPDSLNILDIKVSAIGFAEEIKPVQRQSQIINFSLIEKITTLPTVKVKNKPISVQGDTTNYNVSSFATSQDRVIGDIIAKLPGIEVDADGAISYNGKPITNYYINGLDLLEKKYSIANDNIPFDLVEKVQLLNNHQPVRALDSIRSSTNPALNIQLNKKGMNKLIGTAKAGVGLMPFLSDDAIAGMQFNKGFQLISAYKFNNTGTRLGNELIDQVSIHEIGEPDRENLKENLLSLISLPQPPLQESRFLFNNNHLFHLSALKVLKNSGQIKFNIGYISDYNRSKGSNFSTLYLPSDTIKLNENLKTEISTHKLNGDFYYTLNKSNKYIKNASKIQIDFNNEYGTIANMGNLNQRLKNPFYQVENNFLILTPIKKKLVSFMSSTFLNRTPQNLSIRPGPFSNVFNESSPYDRIVQNASLTKFISDNSLSFIIKAGPWEQEVRAGGQYIYKQLESSLAKENNQIIYQLNDSFRNQINWQNIRLYGNANTTINVKKKQIQISLPVEYNNLFNNNKVIYSKQNQSYVFFNPNLSLTLPIGPFFTSEINYHHHNSVGNFLQTTPGFILINYRTINQNDAQLPVQASDNFTLSGSFKNPLKGLFGYLSATYSNTNNNIIYTQSYQNIFSKTTSLLFPNTAKSFMASGRINKYFFQRKTNVSFSVSYSLNKSLWIQQNDFVNIVTHATILSSRIQSDNWTFLSAENDLVFSIFSNSIEPFTKNSSTFSTAQLQDRLNLSFILSKRITMFLNSEYYYFTSRESSSNDYYFGDVGVKISYKKIELQLAFNNLTNNKYFVTHSLSDNFKAITQTQIRPRTLMIKCYFRF